jgi:hypothetical protein
VPAWSVYVLVGHWIGSGIRHIHQSGRDGMGGSRKSQSEQAGCESNGSERKK